MMMTEDLNRASNDADSIWPRLALFSGVFIMCVGLVVAVVFWSLGGEYVVPVLVAGLVCYVTGVLAHLLGEFPQGELFIMSRLLSSSLVRMGGPLAFLLVIKFSSSPWMGSEIVYVVVTFYLVMLVTDVGINLKHYQAISRLQSPTFGAKSGH